MSQYSNKAESAGVRTPIRFGVAVEKTMKGKMSSWEKLEVVDSEKHLFYLFTRKVIKDWHGFILIQGARRAGRFTVELAISRRPVLPLHSGRIKPVYAVDGVRERLAFLSEQEDQWWEYRTQEQLEEKLRETLMEVYTRGHMFLHDHNSRMLTAEMERGRSLVRQWREQEAVHSGRPLGTRYPDLMMENQAYDYLMSNLMYDSVNRCLGPLRKRYMDPRWQACHVFVMSSLLEMTNLGDLDDLVDKVPAMADDEAEVLIGRLPVYRYLKSPEAFEDRMKRYAFFKSLEILDAYFDEEGGAA